jgi:hypothetical protein
MGNRMKLTSNSSLFYCQSSQRYISKHRLFNDFFDCYFREDELIPYNCSLDDSPLYSCKWKSKCLLSLGIDYSLNHCKTHYDTPNTNSQQNIFQRICNGIDNNIREGEFADEFHCELWPCYNPYTRCDDLFQCANLIDEVGCPNYNCSANELKCDIDYSNDYRCIPYDHIYEKPRMNCIKKNPSSRFSRNLFYSNNFTNSKHEYISWKNKTCLTKSDLCGDNQSIDNRLICSKMQGNIFKENILQIMNMNDDQLLCELTSVIHPGDIPLRFFSTYHLGYFPSKNKTFSPEYINNKSMKNLHLKTNIELIEYCHRGILIYEGQSYIKRCLCPPNYFGQRCQWQSQRISLTFRIRQLLSFEKKDFIYELFIYLIDNQNGIIQNYERINFIPSIDCDTKFDRYLIYPTRPKNKNYSIHIDLYDKIRLKYYSSWYLPIIFSFLPVNRISTLLIIPTNISQLSINCSLDCGSHGKCLYYVNSNIHVHVHLVQYV